MAGRKGFADNSEEPKGFKPPVRSTDENNFPPAYKNNINYCGCGL